MKTTTDTDKNTAQRVFDAVHALSPKFADYHRGTKVDPTVNYEAVGEFLRLWREDALFFVASELREESFERASKAAESEDRQRARTLACGLREASEFVDRLREQGSR